MTWRKSITASKLPRQQTPKRSDSPEWRKKTPTPTTPVANIEMSQTHGPEEGTAKIEEVTKETDLATLKVRRTKIEEMIQEARIEELEVILAALETDMNAPLQDIWINAKTNVAMELAKQENTKKTEKTLKEMVPEQLMEYKDVFDKEKAS